MAKPPAVCRWRRSPDPDEDAWDGDCGVKWVLGEGTPYQHGMSFCPRCGKALKEAR
jgi:hypothetical protein